MADQLQLAPRIGADVENAARAYDRLEREMRQAGGAASAAAGGARRAGTGIRNSGQAAARAARGWNQAANSFRDMVAAGALGNVMSAGILRIVDSVSRLPAELVQAGVAAESLEQRFRFTFDSAAEGARQLDFVRSEAERLGLDFATAAQSFSGLAAATRGTALEGAATRETFTAVAEASRAMGLSSEQASDALLALQQIASKGAVSAEDLRGQLGDRLPGAFQIAARAMGVTTGEFSEMLARGEVMTEDFLPRFSRALREYVADDIMDANVVRAATDAGVYGSPRSQRPGANARAMRKRITPPTTESAAAKRAKCQAARKQAPIISQVVDPSTMVFAGHSSGNRHSFAIGPPQVPIGKPLWQFDGSITGGAEPFSSGVRTGQLLTSSYMQPPRKRTRQSSGHLMMGMSGV